METKVTPTDRYDHLEAQRFTEMVQSESFRALWARIAAELERERGTCERNGDIVEVHRAQGACRSLRAVLGLPDLILKELKSKKR